ncbi:MAG: hypothetical protein ACLTTZ_06410 [Lachnospiraceae bacterium]
MLDERKVKLMTRLAFYEQTQGKEDFKISAYYRKDYTSLHMLCSFIWVTIGYVLVVGLAVLAGLDSLLGHMSMAVMVLIGGMAIVGWLAVVIIYALTQYNEKHKNSRQRVKKYNHDLTRLLKMYAQTDSQE